VPQLRSLLCSLPPAGHESTSRRSEFRAKIDGLGRISKRCFVYDGNYERQAKGRHDSKGLISFRHITEIGYVSRCTHRIIDCVYEKPCIRTCWTSCSTCVAPIGFPPLFTRKLSHRISRHGKQIFEANNADHRHQSRQKKGGKGANLRHSQKSNTL
jgi:hypothetical protein